MAKIKIFLDNSETMSEAEDLLYKALEIQRTGDSHVEEFLDPAMTDIHDKLMLAHEFRMVEMLEEIFQVLDEEFHNDYK